MPPLPPPLAAAFQASLRTAGGKRERTQAQLVQAAVQVFSEQGVAAASVQRIAQVAGVTPGTFYNHFPAKEDLVARVAVVLAGSLCRAINDSYAHITDGAQRMAIGQRRYVGLAAESPAWALLMLDVAAANPGLLEEVHSYAIADLRIGVQQRHFRIPSEEAAMDAIGGIGTSAMRRVALGLAPPHHDVACAAMVLRALGMAPDAAAEVARRPLPPLDAA
jgi:AcrR family transcriptional regulator